MTRQIVCMLYVVISALGFGSVSGCRDNEQERLPLQPTRRVLEILERIGFSNIPRDPPRFSVSDDTVDAVRATYLRLLEAYTNNQVELMRRIEMTMPLAITGMHQSVLFPLSTTFNRMFNERFLWAEDIRTFPNASELDAFLAANIEAARFSGEVLLSRRDFSGNLLVLDKNMYRQLQRYKQRYVDTGCQEMADCVETYVRKWVSQIESKNGFMRKYMGFDLLLQSPHALQGSMSEVDLLKAVRKSADGLVKSGYTPRWLDEDFPLPPPDDGKRFE